MAPPRIFRATLPVVIATIAMGMAPRLPGQDADGMVVVEFQGETAVFPRFEVPADAKLTRDWTRRNREWLERTIGVPFAAAVKGQPWEKQAVDFISEALDAWRAPGGDHDPRPDLAEAGRALAKKGCGDPLVRFFTSYYGYSASRQVRQSLLGITRRCGYAPRDAEPHVREMEKAVNELEAAGYPKTLLRLLASEIYVCWAHRSYLTRGAPWGKKVGAWTAAALAEGSYSGDDGAFFVGQTKRWQVWARAELPIIAAAVDESSLVPWARKTALGNLAVRAGWVARGGGWASSVTDEGWRKFEENLGKAAQYMEEAWNAAPEHPEAPAEMMKTIFTGNGKPGDNPHTWFLRAVAAEADYEQAYSGWLWYRRPRWGGSPAQMLAFSRACLEAKRHDTRIPEYFAKGIMDTISETGYEIRDVARIPWVAEGLVSATQGQLEHAKNPRDKERLQSLLVVRAWMAGRMDVAKDAMRKVPKTGLHIAALDTLQNAATYPDVLLSDLSVHGTPAWDAYDKGREAVRSHEYPEAVPALESALAVLPEGHPAVPAVRSELAIARFGAEYAKGGWTPVPLDAGAWRLRAGSISNSADGALLIHTKRSERGFAYFKPPVGLSYQIRGKFSAQPGSKTAPTLGIGVRAHRRFADEYFHFTLSPNKEGTQFQAKLRAHFEDVNEKGAIPGIGNVPVRAENEFLATVTPTSMALEVNGETGVPEFANTEYVRREVDGRIAVVMSQFAPQTTTRLSSLEIRKTGAAKEEEKEPAKDEEKGDE